MNSNVNLESMVGAPGLTGTGFVLLFPGPVFAHPLWRKKARRPKGVPPAASAAVVLYFGLAPAFSAASEERVLARGGEKYLCEPDCHLAYPVLGVGRAKTPGGATAGGEFYVVTPRRETFKGRGEGCFGG